MKAQSHRIPLDNGTVLKTSKLSFECRAHIGPDGKVITRLPARTRTRHGVVTWAVNKGKTYPYASLRQGPKWGVGRLTAPQLRRATVSG